MTLTLQQIYERYSNREFARVVEIKRLNQDGVTYENDWQNVEDLSGLKLLDKAVKSISSNIANSNYNFGIVTVKNLKISLLSKNGQFDDENNSTSVFNGFLRHGTLIRVRDGYIDKYSNPSAPQAVLNTVFEGFIDDTSSSTKVDDKNILQDFLCIDLLAFLLKKYTLADMGVLTSTTIDDLIFEILNRSEFTNFFTVSAANINAGYNATSFDVTQYENQTQLYTLFENISLGHSFFYVRDNVFYYTNNSIGISNTLEIDYKKAIKLSFYTDGASNVFERLFWYDQPTITYTSPTIKYNKGKTINIEGITDNTQRQNLLDFVGAKLRIQRQEFKLTIPYYMNVNIMDTIFVKIPQIIPDDALIWGYPAWGQKRWRKAIQASNIASSGNWLVREVKHNAFKTQLTLQQIV